MTIQAVYPGIWAGSARQGPSDPFFSNVVNLSHFDGTNGSTTYVDSSTHATNLGAGTGTSLSTTQAQFGTASLNCANSSNHGAFNSGLALYNIGTANFTLECWVFPTTISSAQNFLYWDVSAGGPTGLVLTAAGVLKLFVNNVAEITGATSFTNNAWNFVAYSRTGGNLGTLYLGGASQGTWADNFNYTSNSLYVGCFSGFVAGLQSGFIDDFRFTIGTGRYSGATCPVPSAPFPNH